MANQQKIVVRTSGWLRYFLLAIMAMVAFVFYITVADIFAKGATVIHVVGVALYAWMEFSLYQALADQKIVLDGTTLIPQMLIPGRALNKFETHQTDLSEIQSVMIARIHYYTKHAKEFKDMNLIKKIEKERVATQKGPVPVPWRAVSKHSSLMYILPRDNTKKTIVVRMAPFTKKNIMRLVREFRSFGIPVIIESALVTKKFS